LREKPVKGDRKGRKRRGSDEVRKSDKGTSKGRGKRRKSYQTDKRLRQKKTDKGGEEGGVKERVGVKLM